jgi:hypothetical protein
MYGRTEARLGDRMRGGGPDRMNGQGGKKDFITCKGANDLVDYDRGPDVLQGCATRRFS